MQKTIHSQQQEILRAFLIALRKKCGLTQRTLAQRLKREHSFIARIELGERRLDLIEFWYYCHACEVEPKNAASKLMVLLGKS